METTHTDQERKARKRAQNRLNQRARRERLRRENEDRNGPGKRPYRVDRWRIGTDANNEEEPKSASTKNMELPREEEEPPSQQIIISDQPSSNLAVVIPVDHRLLHLISYNVCRGMMTNKTMMRLFAEFIIAFDFPTLEPQSKSYCDIAVVRPIDREHLPLPTRLEPTQIQMTSPHPCWIDIFPFPELRDNLIRKQFIYDHIQFLEDLVGDFVYILPPAVPSTRCIVPPFKKLSGGNQPKENAGMILWGEPHLSESWEVTPSFLAKWSWLIGECKDLVHVSNNWRQSRGDQPLRSVRVS
ncbi:hypothetical protein FMUND_15341 [Fusarium mundagurra]|uniref:BZIP domain-containing protein n=1 Tax=Fusarium mundagurra TaxID=1567541 RepID=A0A8H5XQH3_9HYPO|nr:hypothetical protein FMUND_15341 [Fusarium mundagurra]